LDGLDPRVIDDLEVLHTLLNVRSDRVDYDAVEAVLDGLCSRRANVMVLDRAVYTGDDEDHFILLVLGPVFSLLCSDYIVADVATLAAAAAHFEFLVLRHCLRRHDIQAGCVAEEPRGIKPAWLVLSQNLLHLALFGDKALELVFLVDF